MVWVLSTAGLLLAYLFVVAALHRRHPEPHWNWDEIDVNDLDFPPHFLWGSATAAHQVEGGNTNNWSRWETQVKRDGSPCVHDGVPSGKAADHYERYPEDIALMRDVLKLNSYRFSVEWSRIEPSPGEFDEEAIAHYHRVIDALLEAGISPMVTLHHFTNPLWFEDKGGFEHRENIAYFVAFSERMFAEFGGKVSRWCTINESGPYAVMGYGLGVFPPGVKSYRRMAHVLHHMMIAHIEVYDRLKAMPGGQQAQIGLVKSVFQFDPYHRWNLAHWAAARVMDATFNESILGLFRHGTFRVHIPMRASLVEEHPDAVGKLDFIGLNYYSHLLISAVMKKEPPFVPQVRRHQTLTDMPYAVYAEGFYRALQRVGSLGVPIVVTENGIADAEDDRRELWIRRYIYAMNQAMKDGCDVRGYHYWTLLDNFEWAEGFAMRFGLIHIDFETQQRTVRRGAQAYVELVERFSSHD